MECHGRSWKVMEGHGRSWKVMEGQGMSWKVIEGLFLSSDCHFKWEKLGVVCEVGYVGMCSRLCCGGL